MKRLLLADHNAFTRRLVRYFLTLSGDWEICAEAADGNEAVEKAKFSHPDVAILDIAMPGLNGVEAARKIVQSSPETAALAISMSDPNVVPDRLMQAGIRGFVSKYRLASELVPAIEALLEGENLFCGSEPQPTGCRLDLSLVISGTTDWPKPRAGCSGRPGPQKVKRQAALGEKTGA